MFGCSKLITFLCQNTCVSSSIPPKQTRTPRFGNSHVTMADMDESNLRENENEVQVVLSDLQDTDNPLSSIKTFEDLNL